MGTLVHAQQGKPAPKPFVCCDCYLTLTAQTDDGQVVPPDTPGDITTSTTGQRANGRVQVYTPITLLLHSDKPATCVWDVYASTGNGSSSYTSSAGNTQFRITPNQPVSAVAPNGSANSAQYYDIHCTVSLPCAQGVALSYGLYSYPIPGTGGGGGGDTPPDPGPQVRSAHLDMYPNPADHHMLVSVPHQQTGEAIVYDSHGLVKARVQVRETTEIATQSLPAGIYFLRVEGANGQSVMKRFTIQH